MTQYHLAHCFPHPKSPQFHGHHGYKEVIETVAWGLEQLGHQVTYGVNQVAAERTNIVFGAQVVPIDQLENFPDDTIVYHLEQMGDDPDQIRAEMKYCAERFIIWEYSAANIDCWTKLRHQDVRIVPVGYAPILSRIPKSPGQDIDVLIYGSPGANRLSAFHRLACAGLAVVFVSGIYGSARDNLISRSKLVLNINLYSFGKIFEIVRVSYLLANKKAVVADLLPDAVIEDDIRSCVKFSSLENLAADCIHLVQNEHERLALEEAGFVSFQRRDIRKILSNVLG